MPESTAGTHKKRADKPSKLKATPPSITRFPTAVNHGYQQKCVTLFSPTVGSCSVPICIQLAGWMASQPGLYTRMKGFYGSFHV